ncbi:MAG: hypothetical protein WC865_12475 [Bacteroidales bacterium]
MNKKSLLFGIVLITSINLSCQDFKIEREDNNELKKFIEKISFFEVIWLNDNLVTTVLFTCNPIGSAQRQGTGEITNNIYLLVCEAGEYPECHLYVLKDIYFPKLLSNKALNNNSEIGFSYKDKNDDTKEIHLKKSLNEVSILKE